MATTQVHLKDQQVFVKESHVELKDPQVSLKAQPMIPACPYGSLAVGQVSRAG
ncbi:hypothetical protein HQ585_18045 [candidate division KSB1 bacterium]|nr:hypothetical protein [candidate division KSB1 bacterium]